MRFLSDWRVRGSLAALALGSVVAFSLSGSLSTDSSAALKRLNPFSDSDNSAAVASTPVRHSQFGKLPLFFEKNEGQTHPDVKYLSRGNGYTLYLTADEAVFQLASNKNTAHNNVLRARLLGANRSAKTLGEDKQPGQSNYFVGNDSAKWHSNIANYGRVRYEAVYPGIDLVYYGNQGQLEYDFVVKPGSNPDAIRFAYEGAESVHLDKEGNLIAETEAGPVTQFKPIAYQHINGERRAVESRFLLAQNNVSFQLGNYDPQHELVIDPVLVYSTFMGSHINHALNGIAVDAAGNAYVAGTTSSNNYPQKNPLPGSPVASSSNSMAIVSKLSADGSQLLYSTYLGGITAFDEDCNPANPASCEPVLNGATAITVTAAGDAYIAGLTNTSDFPLLSPFQSANKNPYGSSFLTKIAPNGQSLIFSTYLGGEKYVSGGSTDAISAVALRSEVTDVGVVVAGQTGSKDFPTTPGALKESLDTSEETAGFATAFDENGARIFSTLIGGIGNDTVNAIAVDNTGVIHLTGSTTSSDFPTTDGSVVNSSGATVAFYLRLQPNGSDRSFATLFGSATSQDEGQGIAVSPVNQDVWIIGTTQGSDFPHTSGGTLPASAIFLKGYDASNAEKGSFILGKLDTSGSGSNAANRLGVGKAVTIDHLGKIYVTGIMRLVDIERVSAPTPPVPFPTVTDPANYFTSFISKLDTDGSTVIYTTDLRGNKGETDLQSGGIQSMALDSGGALYVTGSTLSDNFPTVNALYPTSTAAGEWKGFVAKLGEGPVITITASPSVIAAGQTSTITWSVDGTATQCDADSTNSLFQGSQPLPAAGSNQTVSVSESVVGDHVYKLTCQDASGNASTAFTTLRVAGPPQIQLSLSKSQVITNESSVLTWSAFDNNGPCIGSSTPADSQFDGNKLNTGSLSIHKAAAGTATYTLSCTGFDGNLYHASQTLTVHNPPTVTLTPSTNVPGYAMTGETIQWSWVSTDASSCELSDAITETGIPVPTGNRSITAGTHGAATLKITCTGPTAATATTSSSVTIYDPAVPPSLTLSSNRSPSNTIMGKESVMLTWNTTNAESCTASSTAATPEANWNGSKGINGSVEITPPMPAGGYGSTTTYSMSCSRPGINGTVSEHITFTINHPRPVHSARLSPSSVYTGETSTFSWSSIDAVRCEATGLLADNNLPVSGSREITAPATAGNPKIWLKCFNADDVPSVIKDYTLTVSAKPANNQGNGADSGGSFDPLLLLGIGLAGLRWRKTCARQHS